MAGADSTTFLHTAMAEARLCVANGVEAQQQVPLCEQREEATDSVSSTDAANAAGMQHAQQVLGMLQALARAGGFGLAVQLMGSKGHAAAQSLFDRLHAPGPEAVELRLLYNV